MTDSDYKPGLEDVPAAKSAISFIDGKRAQLKYRGFPVEVLARESNFEETAWLLLKGDLPTQKQLAEKCGTTKTYISRIENDASDIRLSTLMRIIHEGLGGRLRLSVER